MTSGEEASERWLPTRSVSTILLSVISMLSSPNFSSPANVDASVEMRDRPEQFRQRVAKLVARANAGRPTGLVIPHPDSNPQERSARVERYKRANETVDMEELAYDEPAEIQTDDSQSPPPPQAKSPNDHDEDERKRKEAKGKQRCVEELPVAADKPTSELMTEQAPAPPANLKKRKKKHPCAIA